MPRALIIELSAVTQKLPPAEHNLSSNDLLCSPLEPSRFQRKQTLEHKFRGVFFQTIY